MRLSPLVSSGMAVIAALALLWSAGSTGCSLSLEDPEVEARKKLEKVVPTSWELLEGRWVGDSTYTLFDTRADNLDSGLILDIFPDSSYWAKDAAKLIFPGTLSAPARLSGDTLFFTAAGAVKADTMLVRLRFLGNYLELVRSSDQRSTHFHKLKPLDSSVRDSLLDSGVWIRRVQRHAFDSVRVEALRRDFDYLRFSGDSLYRDTRRDGLSTVEAGPLEADGRRFAWTPGTGGRSVHVDLFHADSLRFWPMEGGRADSGYSLYVRAQRVHPLDLDMTPYAGHLRGDTLKTDFTTMEHHFGRYYDLVLGTDHKVTTLTNMPAMPRFRGWSIDSGFLYLEDTASARTRARVEFPTAKGIRIQCDSGQTFSRRTTLIQTAVDGSRFAEHPLERFDQAGYMWIAVGPDTLSYFFLAAGNRNSPEEHEMALIDTADTLWAIWRVNPALETFGSSQAGFLFAFQGRTAALGRFTCRSQPTLDLALRTTASADPSLAKGLVQGSCRILSSEKAPADTALAVTGEFRSKRRTTGMASPLWRLP